MLCLPLSWQTWGAHLNLGDPPQPRAGHPTRVGPLAKLLPRFVLGMAAHCCMGRRCVRWGQALRPPQQPDRVVGMLRGMGSALLEECKQTSRLRGSLAAADPASTTVACGGGGAGASGWRVCSAACSVLHYH